MSLFKLLMERTLYLSKRELISETSYSKSQFYVWLKEVRERKQRGRKVVPEPVVLNAIETIFKYPHFSAPKGQGYMIYYQLGYIPQHAYKTLKKIVKCIVFQEVSKRELLPKRTSYEHVRPAKAGEIWAEDFTRVQVEGVIFYVAVVIDVFSSYYLGAIASSRVNAEMIEIPIQQSLEITEGRGPDRFLLSDNGKPYVSNEHGELLDKLDIVHKNIPACIPQYNGSCECGIKEFKNVFYNVWAEKFSAESAKGKTLLERVQSTVAETVQRMNFEIPRPRLNGVTPGDVLSGEAEDKIAVNQIYLEQQQKKKEENRSDRISTWQLAKEILLKKEMNDLELMTKFCFFLKRPLRKLPKLSTEVLGN